MDFQALNNTTNKRSALLIKNVIASFIIKGWSAVIVLLMVPLTLKMLGVYCNGVWLTISSVLIWLDLMDIGLGNGLRNAVANYIAKGEHEKVRQAVSSTYFMLLIIVIPIVLILYGIIWGFDMYAAIGVNKDMVPNLNTILAVAVSFASATFILKSVGNFYMGLQLPAVNNLIVCLGQTLALILTFAAYIIGIRSLLCVVAINTMAPLLIWAACIPYTYKKRYPQYCPGIKYINTRMAYTLYSTGMQFFVLQICGVILFMTTNIIISKLFSPAEVTPYQVAYRYFHLTFVVFSTICMPFWNATTDAFARNDIDWLRKSDRKLNLLMVGAIIALVVMVFLSDFVYRIWVGTDIIISKDLSVCVAVYMLILILSQRYSYILNGLGVLRIQLIFTTIATASFLPLAWYVCKTYESVTGLVWVMCIVNTPGLIANYWKYHSVINKTK